MFSLTIHTHTHTHHQKMMMMMMTMMRRTPWIYLGGPLDSEEER